MIFCISDSGILTAFSPSKMKMAGSRSTWFSEVGIVILGLESDSRGFVRGLSALWRKK